MSENIPKAIKYIYNETENCFQMISIKGEKTLVGMIIDEIPQDYVEEVIGVQYELSKIHEWSSRMARTYQVSLFGIHFNIIKLTKEHNDYQMFPTKEKKEELIKEGNLDLLIGPKVNTF